MATEDTNTKNIDLVVDAKSHVEQVVFMKVDDLLPILQGHITHERTGADFDLTSATVAIEGTSGAGTLVVDGACTILTPNTDGKFSYTWEASDTANANELKVEFKVTVSAKVMTLPNNGFVKLIIEQAIA